MKKRIVLLPILFVSILIILLIFLLNLNKNEEKSIVLDDNYTEWLSETSMQKFNKCTEIAEYKSEMTAGYINNDGSKSLLIFSSPIRFRNAIGNLVNIDTRIINIDKGKKESNNYAYTVNNNDIQPYYPFDMGLDHGILIQQNQFSYEFGFYDDQILNSKYVEKDNFIYNTKNMILYDNTNQNKYSAYFYPSLNGTNCELSFKEIDNSENEIKFWLKLDNQKFTVEKAPGGYLAIMEKDDIVGVIQAPMIKNSYGNISVDNSIEVSKNNDGVYILKCILDKDFLEKGSIAFLSFEIYRGNQPDNAIYSKKPDLHHAYLTNYACIGNCDNYGKGRLLLRFKINDFVKSIDANITNATFYTYRMNGRNNIEVLSVLEEWCSIFGNWNSNYKLGSTITTYNNTDKSDIISFDITQTVKNWVEDKTNHIENCGLLLKSQSEEEGTMSLLLTNDNTLFNNVTEIILR